MIHVHYFITRKPSLADAEFHRYWRENHAPIVRRISGLRRYLQSHRIPFPGTNSTYDGEAEVWLDNLAALDELRHDPSYLEGALVDEPNFIDLTRADWMATQDYVLLDGPQSPDLLKGVYRFRRRAGMSVADFRRYWLEVHGALGLKIPGLRRYVQSHTVDAAYSYAEPRWDGVAQLWFDGIDALKAALESPEWRDDLARDGPEFIEMETLSNFVAREYQVIWPA